MNLRELVDDKTSYSTTRWAFVVCTRVAIALAFLVIGAVIAGTIFNKPMPDGLLGGAAAIIGVLAGIPTVAKTAQGFETKRTEDKPEVK